MAGIADVAPQCRECRCRHRRRLLSDKGLGRACELERAPKHARIRSHTGEGGALRRQLQPNLRIVRKLNRLESMAPGGWGLVMQVEPPARRKRAGPDMGKL